MGRVREMLIALREIAAAFSWQITFGICFLVVGLSIADQSSEIQRLRLDLQRLEDAQIVSVRFAAETRSQLNTVRAFVLPEEVKRALDNAVSPRLAKYPGIRLPDGRSLSELKDR